jgi:predicted chitinase
MKTEVLHKKIVRYLDGRSMPAEKNQIQNWLSTVDKSNLQMSDEDKLLLENEILADIQGTTNYPALFPKLKPWWLKMTTFFE